MPTKVVLLIVCTILILGLAELFDDSSHRSDFFDNTLKRLNSETLYQVIGDERKGTLGEFYTCLSKYRNINSMSPKEGEIYHYKIEVLDSIYLIFSVIDGEAFRFYVSENSRNIETRSYAINCNIDLLKELKTK